MEGTVRREDPSPRGVLNGKLLLGLGLLGGLGVFIAVSGSHKEAVAEPENLTTAAIQVNPSELIGPISDLIYGVGIEWTENGNRILDPATGMLREDMISQLKP